MKRSHLLLASLLSALAAGACDNGSPNDPDPDWPPQGTLVSGNLQQATVGTQLADPIVVRVTDQDGDAIPGLSVTFAVTAGGGTLFAATAETNASGEASNRWTLGTVADSQRVEARVIDPESGQPVVLATFVAIGRADVPATITARPPAARTGSAGHPLADSLEALVQDRHGNPVPGATVTWLATSGGGTVSPATTTTGTNGIARASWTLGRQIGTQQTAEASLSPAVRAQFTATAGVPLGAVLVKVSGDEQTGTVGTSLAQPAVVEARTSMGLPLQGVAVTWTPATGSGTATPPVFTTGPDGRASTTWTLGTTPGAHTLMASADGVTPVVFQATTQPGAAASLTVVGGDGQTAPPTSALPEPLAVQIADGYGNPLSGVTVNWTVTVGGGSVAPSSSQTNATGIAQTEWTLGPTAGAQTARASAAGMAPVAIMATGQVGPVDSIILTPATVNLAQLGATAQLTARAVDTYGNTVSGTTITWTSVNGAVAGVNASGLVTANGNGTTQVRASGGGKMTAVNVTVQQVAWSVAITGGPRVVETDTLQLTATVRDAKGEIIVGAPVTWTTDAPAVATVSPTGLVTGTGGGTAVITATSGTATRTRSVTVQAAFRADSVSVGSYHACALGASGTASCWGFNRTRQLASSTPPVVVRPAVIAGQSFVAITTGSSTSGLPVSFTCGLQADGDALCWGSNESGQLGYDDGPRSPDRESGNCDGQSVEEAYPVICTGTPTQTAGGGWRQVDAGANHTCAVTTGGAAFCWGRSTVGQLGSTAATETCYDFNEDSSLGSFACILTPVPVSGGLTWRQVSAGDDFTCGLTDAGAAYCWGLNSAGQLGNGSTTNASAPTPVPGGPYRWISAGRTHACAVTTSGSARCWGSNANGRLGNGSTTSSTTPVTVAAPGGGATWASVEAGDPHTCGVTSTGRAFCWGGNGNGQVGDGTRTDRLVPTQTLTTQTFTVVGTGLNYTCGLSTADILFCWGNGSGGRLANGSQANVNRLVPEAVVAP